MRQNRSRITQPKSNINHIDELKKANPNIDSNAVNAARTKYLTDDRNVTFLKTEDGQPIAPIFWMTWKQGTRIRDIITKKKSMGMELIEIEQRFDKAFDPMLIFSKKRYAGNMYENNADDYVHKYMGIALKRRDNAPIVKTIFCGAMKMLLDKRDVEGAFQFVNLFEENRLIWNAKSYLK
jgi:hypothetical protein